MNLVYGDIYRGSPTFKFFHGGRDCPFEEGDEKFFWTVEKVLMDQLDYNRGFLMDFVTDDDIEAYRAELLSAGVDEEKLSDTQVRQVYYLDLMWGKWRPYDESRPENYAEALLKK